MLGQPKGQRKPNPNGSKPPPSEKKKSDNRIPFTRERKVPATVTPNRESKLRYTAQGDLAESFVVIAIAGDNFQQQLVFHRPIGVTPLAKDDWVCSLQQDIPLLIMRREDPEAESRKQKVQQKLFALAVEHLASKGELIEIKDGEVWYNTKHRPSLLYHARQHAKVAGLKDSTEGGPPPYLQYLESKDRVTEMKLIMALRNDGLRAAAEQAIASTGYETCGGASADKPQMAVPYLKGKDRLQAYDTMLRRLYATVYGQSEDDQDEEQPQDPQGDEDVSGSRSGLKTTFDTNTPEPVLKATEFTEDERILWAQVTGSFSDSSKVLLPKEEQKAQEQKYPVPEPKEKESAKAPLSSPTPPPTTATSDGGTSPGIPPKRSKPKDTRSTGSGNSKKKVTQTTDNR
jgi:hypothetical protein